MLLAHSAEPKKNIPAQSYGEHVSQVIKRAVEAAKNVAYFATGRAKEEGSLLRRVVRLAAEYHDLGKLDPENQKVLAGTRSAKHLPVQHTDAGTAHLVNNIESSPAAVLVCSHHIGLPYFIEEIKRGDDFFRDDSVSAHVNKTLQSLLELHSEFKFNQDDIIQTDSVVSGDLPVFFRLALSCLADGDHSDTAMHYGDSVTDEPCVELKAADRLASLDEYVSKLRKKGEVRANLRSEVYQVCRNAMVAGQIATCDSPVGTGKTTAVMAHLLAQAAKRKLRRIIVVLPFTNIITQSVDVYRKSLVLPGEKAENVITELHHLADFQDKNIRHLTALWKAPIIVTTAVTFFETLASKTPATLRRLHNLPGSAVFIDESHAALPAKLLPLAWHWMKCFAYEWSCYCVLASGSLNKFWEIPEFDHKPPVITEILPDSVRSKLLTYEKERVVYNYNPKLFEADELVDWVNSLPGPRIVILNTVQSAAVVAIEFQKKLGQNAVEHISTALTPNDREKVLERVKKRLQNKSDKYWTLVATSCVEAGVDISFCTGVRELSSFVSLLQTAGRVNRHGNNSDSKVWIIRLSEEGLLKAHPGFREASQVLKEFLETNVAISPILCTEALKREIRLVGDVFVRLKKYEDEMNFPKVEENFCVIPGDKRIAVVDSELIKRLENFENISWRDIQRGSVQIWGYKLNELRIPEFEDKPGLYKWNLQYDDFIGYMSGVLPIEAFKKGVTTSY